MKETVPLTVRSVEKETPDSVRIAFDVPDEHAEEFLGYKEGQHITLQRDFDGREVKRSYSLSTSVADRDLQVVIRHVPGGVFSSFALEELQPGDVIQATPPKGAFRAQLDPANENHYAAFAAGSGITAVMSVIKTILETEPKSRVTLFYGNRNPGTMIFKDDLASLKDRYMQRLNIYRFFSRQSQDIPFFEGRLDYQRACGILDNLLADTPVDDYFVCGPDSMITDVRKALRERGVSSRRIHAERFLNKDQVPEAERAPTAATEQAVSGAKLGVILDGRRTDIDYDNTVGTVLDNALAAALDTPYSCKGGVCTTCRARVIEGTAQMDVCYGLEDKEIEDGFILTCQARPTSETLVVSFDE